MAVAVVLLLLCILLGGTYIIGLKLQLRSLNRQLDKRLREHSREPLSLELIDRDLSALAGYMNRCLQAEEKLRIDALRGEKRFREMISNISHDLRTPLTAIKGYQQLVERGGLTPGQLEKLRIAQNHAGHLGRLIEQLFEYSYLLTAGPQGAPVRFSLSSLVTECLADAVEAFEAQGLALTLHAPSPVNVQADPEMTARIIRNLIANALAHSAGDVKVKVAVEVEGQALLSFRNPLAPGAAPQPERLFERFYTADEARSARFSGLGLHIVKLLAEQMGGSTGAAVTQGRLEVWVKLPQAKAQE
ncbi:sensor histidine kinase [Paenibacillus tepidiphilus]|uniref:sensor histidine kinase n=1 Tax=Paenibacillus tepidiphilus TaxID=2608683 RepID=UPI00123936BB|nr:HAMP domain-containing sensor histidine kinase [Paenibacillus tepidiphilus]